MTTTKTTDQRVEEFKYRFYQDTEGLLEKQDKDYYWPTLREVFIKAIQQAKQEAVEEILREQIADIERLLNKTEDKRDREWLLAMKSDNRRRLQKLSSIKKGK